jgi:hypothetical protein
VVSVEKRLAAGIKARNFPHSRAALAAKKKKRIKAYQSVAKMSEGERRDRFVRFLVTPTPMAIMQYLASQTKDYAK